MTGTICSTHCGGVRGENYLGKNEREVQQVNTSILDISVLEACAVSHAFRNAFLVPCGSVDRSPKPICSPGEVKQSWLLNSRRMDRGQYWFILGHESQGPVPAGWFESIVVVR